MAATSYSHYSKCRIFTMRVGRKERLIYAPNEELRARQDVHRLMLEVMQERVDVLNVAHGFRRGRSPVTNAMCHVGKFDVTVAMDLKDFFESCDAKIHFKAIGKLPGFADDCLVWSDALKRPIVPQGYTTSPFIANIAAAKLDRTIVACLNRLFPRFVYTRYADDLTVSLKGRWSPIDVHDVKTCINTVKDSAETWSFRVNDCKTVVYWAKAGRRVVTGIAVDEHGVYPTREAKRKLRAAKNQNKQSVVSGLEGWVACKPPKEMT